MRKGVTAQEVQFACAAAASPPQPLAQPPPQPLAQPPPEPLAQPPPGPPARSPSSTPTAAAVGPAVSLAVGLGCERTPRISGFAQPVLPPVTAV